MSEPTDERWLRDGLAGAVPEPPATPDRADGARAIARRARRTTAAVVGGVAASVLLVAGVVAVLGDDDPDGSDVANDGPVSPYDAPACPATPVDTRTQVGPDHVPDGATSVRLCDGNEIPIEVPKDALVTDVDTLAAAVNDLEPKATDAMCTMDLGPAYQLVFTYPDGSTTVASGELYGCDDVVVHGAVRTGAYEPWEKFIALLRAQRASLDPPAPADPSTIDCPGSGGFGRQGAGQVTDLVVAKLCVGGKQAAISADELQQLVADVAANTTRSAAYVSCAAESPLPALVGATAWGDRVVVASECGTGWFVVDSTDHSVWRPGTAATTLIERLVEEAR